MEDDEENPFGFKPAAELRTPAEWAERLGHIRRAHPHIPQSTTHPDWRHAVADGLHGWTKHAYHYANDPQQISEADYLTALKKAAVYPLEQAHEPALSPTMKAKEKV